MLLNQIILYFMTGGTEEEVKEEIKRKIKCGVEIEEVDKEEAQTLVFESASAAVDTSEVEILSRQGAETETEPEEETPGLESISEDEKVNIRNVNNSEHENTVEVVEKEIGDSNIVDEEIKLGSDQEADKTTEKGENPAASQEQTDGNVATEEWAGENLTTEKILW